LYLAEGKSKGQNYSRFLDKPFYRRSTMKNIDEKFIMIRKFFEQNADPVMVEKYARFFTEKMTNEHRLLFRRTKKK